MSRPTAAEVATAIGESTTDDPTDQQQTSSVEHLYRTLWRWHFWAGVLVAPVLIWAAVTGSIYIFAADIEPWLYDSMMYVEPGSQPVSLDEQRAAIQERYPGFRVSSLAVTGINNRATEFDIRNDDGLKHLTYVNPYSAEVTGKRIFQDGFFEIIRILHRRMYAGTTGRVVTETATSWGIILLLTGIVLWWPRKSGKVKSGRQGVWTVRMRSGTRIALRDLHAVCGMYLMPVAITIMLTGLFFSNTWGSNFRSVARSIGSFPESESNPPQSTPTDGGTTIPLQDVFDQAATGDSGLYPIRIRLPKDEKESYAVYMGGENNPVRHVVSFVDQYSGEVLARTDFSNSSALLLARNFAYPLHVGSIFGLSTKLLALVACMVIILSTVTGVLMWWRSRPAGRIGLPVRNSQYRLRWVPVVLLWVVAAFLPMAAASLIVVLVADWLVIRRFAKERTTEMQPSSPNEL